ncbi:cobalamin biosynthesis protein [Dysosmobacter sp. Sow4_B12]|uniref:cobalamin biosynthesis protein n=1 Tax=Dysosmobacter sp. Sow4_B12 TaxID=3438777 RepID=UPI003F8EBCAE
MKKGAKIALGVVGVLVVGGVAAAAWQWNNLNALRYGLTMDSGTIEQKLQENEKALQDAMTEYKIPQYTFSQEEIAQLTDGTLSTEEAAKRLLEAQTPLAAAPEGQADAQQAAEPPSEVDQAIQEQIATMYVLRSTYVGKLEAIAQSAIDEYSAGAHTEENRKQVVYDKLDQLTALEKECDDQVAQVVARLRELLKEAGRDDSLAKQVEQTYQEEKSLKKAAYLEAFQNG